MNFIDDLGTNISLRIYPPQRIISVVPSLTELLYDLGLKKEIVGITKFCVFPDSIYRTKTRIGGTKTLNIEKIKSLEPDLIIANKEENQQEEVEKLSTIFPTYVTDIKLLEDAIEKIKIIGDLTGKDIEAQLLNNEIAFTFNSLSNFKSKPNVAYMIWKDPLMVAGGDTYINEMLNKSGFKNVFAKLKRYPVVKKEDLIAAKIDYVFLSSEPFPFKKRDIAYFESLIPKTQTILVDGTMFSWYGSRLRLAPPYFLNLRQELNL